MFEPHSRANHEALVELREILEHLGFRVVKKIEKEDTLRAYPQRLYQYPLLNPRFVRQRVNGLSGNQFLEIRVWSKGNDRLESHLRSYRPSTETTYVPGEGEPSVATEGFVLHGTFYFRVHVRDSKGHSLDLSALGSLCKELRDFLHRAA